MQKLNKKGEIGINQIVGIIVIILVVGIILTIGLRIDDDLQRGGDTTVSTITLANETTATVVNITGTNVGEYTTTHNSGCAITVTSVTNSTGTPKIVIPSSNYTVSVCTITSTDASDGSTNELWNVSGSVTYSKDDAAYNATNSVMEGKTNVSENLGLLGTVIIFGVIIALVVVSFAIGRT